MELHSKQFRKRSAILACLRSTQTHPCAEWVYRRLKPDFPDLSLGTVYRNLTLFKEQGLIRSLGGVDGVERFDANMEPHAHFLCRQCGSIADLPQPEQAAQLCSDAASQVDGQIMGCDLSFYGLCWACAQKNSEPTFSNENLENDEI